jgi:Flp pilus assembly protein protease CpaA
MIWLCIYALAISLYDLRTRRIPNWYTLPLVLSGMIAHFPGHLDVWLASFILLYAWLNHWMGAGDVKLWLALLWALPVESSSHSLPFMFVSIFLTGLAQMLWRVARREPIINQLTPAAWRTLPFILLSWHVH